MEYFTPEIEDIHIGYECEIWWNENMLPESKWCPIKVGFDGTEDFDFTDYAIRVRTDKIRVPYLTKEQIEAEGWKHQEGCLYTKGEAEGTQFYVKYLILL